MTSIGVVDHKCSFVPKELKVIRKELYSSWFFFAEQNTILSYQVGMHQTQTQTQTVWEFGFGTMSLGLSLVQ
jgi:hypothetical protein